ncbi:hypothetical protein [Nostoc linckia]|uniref:hypothetical protein n=1 Tax=Nostoc linckia TaxID=92942 RepID=UPI001FD04356|nr:hypothetical protein [Nostoc linckia]
MYYSQRSHSHYTIQLTTKIRKTTQSKGIGQGIREGLFKGIEITLEIKFGIGNEGLTILPEISQIQNIEILNAILSSIKTVNTLEELRQIYQ